QLAGKYEQGYGVPFDLATLPPDPMVDRQNIRYVRIVDVVGSISPEFGSLDSEGNLINEPYPTPFESGGFDLNAVGVLAPNTLSSTESTSTDFTVYPNPISLDFAEVFWNKPFTGTIELMNQVGQMVYSLACRECEKITLNDLPSGIYWLIFKAQEDGSRHQFTLIVSD
ncbi:MAG: T9SS type A sorting domain-containing protein, partial [Bacteroidota bacterium]